MIAIAIAFIVGVAVGGISVTRLWMVRIRQQVQANAEVREALDGALADLGVIQTMLKVGPRRVQ